MITVHCIPDCYKCKNLKNFLKSNKIRYKVANNSKNAGEFPQITDGKYHFIGFEECIDYIKHKFGVKYAKNNKKMV